MIDDLVPQAVRILESGERRHVPLKRLEDRQKSRVILRKRLQRQRQAERREPIPRPHAASVSGEWR